MKKKKALNAALLLGFVAAVFAFMLVLNIMTPKYFDDFRYSFSFADGSALTSFSQIPASMKAHYEAINGRVLTHTLAQAFMIIGERNFDIINTFAFLALIFLIYYHAAGSFRQIKFKYIALIFFSLWLAAPAFGESFLWITGAANYLYSVVLALLCLIPYRHFFKEKSGGVLKEIVLCIVMIPLGFLGAFTNENLSVAFIAAQALFAAAYIINGYKFRAWMPFGIISSCAAAYLMLSSPSYAKRSQLWSLSVPQRIVEAIKNIPFVTYLSIRNMLLPACLVTAAIAVFVVINSKGDLKPKKLFLKNKSVITLFAVYFLFAAVWLFSAVLCDYMPERAYSAPVAAALISALILLMNSRPGKKTLKAANIACAAAAVIIFVGSCVTGFIDIKTVYLQNNERIEIIEQAKAQGIYDVTVKKVTPYTKYSEYYFGGDYSESEKWINDTAAEYYGINSITVE